MAIQLETLERKHSEISSLEEIKKEILAAAKRAEEAGRHDSLIIELPQGKHSITETLTLSKTQNPELAHVDITLRSKVAGAAEINSLVRLDGKDFTPVKGTDYYLYKFKKEKGKYPKFNDFFLNFKRIYKSKSEIFYNLDPFTDDERAWNTQREGFWAPIEIAERIASAEIGATELVMYIEWIFTILHVKAIDLTKTRTVDGKTYALVILKDGEMEYLCKKFPRHLNIKGREMFFQNSPAYLEENTFAYDYFKGRLYINAENPKYMKYHAFEYPALESLVEIEGLENFTVEDVAFSGTTCKYGCDNVYLCDQANTVFRPGHNSRLEIAAILARNTRNFTVDRCSFRHLGTNGVQMVDKSVLPSVKNSRFHDISMSGILIGNPTSAWKNDWERTYAARIENNYLTHIGYEYPACVAIYISMADGLKILHNTVEDCAYTAISAGWNWRPGQLALGETVNIRDAEIAFNYLHNFMQLLKDGGAIYVLGGNCNQKLNADRFNCMHDNFALLDTLVRKYGKYGYYCDGACSNWEVRDSVVLNVDGMPIFSQHHPRALSYHNTFRNIYSNTPRNENTVVPSRDIVTVDYHLLEGTPDEMLAKYPETVKIRDAAGSDLIP